LLLKADDSLGEDPAGLSWLEPAAENAGDCPDLEVPEKKDATRRHVFPI